MVTFLTNYFKYQLEELPKTPLNHWTFWGKQRGGDNLMVVYWLYNITGDQYGSGRRYNAHSVWLYEPEDYTFSGNKEINKQFYYISNFS